MRCFLLASLLVAAQGQAVNPIQKVLSMLEGMSSKVSQVGEESQREYEKFSQWCRDEAKDLDHSLETASSNIADASATIEKSRSDIQSSDARISELSESISSAEDQVKEGAKLRHEEHASFVKIESELKDTVSALERAHGILQKHSFAQVPQNTLDTILSSLESILSANSVNLENKEKLSAFLQAQEDGAPEAKAYEGHSSGILDVIADMLDKAEEQLGEERKKEMTVKHNWEMLNQSLTDQITAENKEMNQIKKQKAEAEETLAVSQAALAEGKKDKEENSGLLRDLHHTCMTRATEFEEEVKERTAELKALAEAKKIISDSTGKAASREYSEGEAAAFVQILSKRISSDSISAPLRRVGLAMLASRVESSLSMGGPFDKVSKMISDMLSKLQAEAEKEASHKAFCDEEMGKSNKKKSETTQRVEDLSTRADKTHAGLSKLKEQVATAQAELAAIIKSQAEMDKMRQEAKALFKEASADYEQGLEGLNLALKVLNDYYATKQEATSFVQVSSKDGPGIINMIEVAESEFSKTLAELRTNENEQQEEYDNTSQKNKVRTATLNAEVTAKDEAIKSTENTLAEISEDVDNSQSELDAVLEGLEKLKDQCVAKAEPYEERKKRREAEIAGLKQALETLENETGTSFLAIRRHY